MIKGRGLVGDRSVLLIGLSGENMTRLMADEPIRFECAELGLPALTVVILGGRTEEAIVHHLRDAGIAFEIRDEEGSA